MRHLIYILSLFACLYHYSNTAFAQENFLTGYYVDDSGERHEGLISDELKREAVSSIKFKPSAEVDSRTIFIEDLQAFGYDSGGLFEKHRVYFTRRKPQVINRNDPEYGLPRMRHDTLLLQLILRGAKDLYYYPESSMEYFFYPADEGDTLVFVGYPPLIDTYGTGLNSAYSNENDYQLNVPRKRLADGSLDAEMPRYNRTAITKYFKNYSRWTGVEAKIIKRKNNKNLFQISVQAEAGAGNLELGFNPPIPDEDNFLDVRIGTRIEALTSILNRRVSVLFDLNYINWSGGFEDVQIFGSSFSSSFNYSGISFGAGIRLYALQWESKSIYFSGMWELPPYNKQTFESSNNTIGDFSESDLDIFYAQSLLELGLKTRKWYAAFRYRFPVSVDNRGPTGALINRHSSLSLQVGYRLF